MRCSLKEDVRSLNHEELGDNAEGHDHWLLKFFVLHCSLMLTDVIESAL